MAKYFNNDELSDLNEARKRIFVERELIYKKYGIDLLDTDSMSSLSIYEIVTSGAKSY